MVLYLSRERTIIISVSILSTPPIPSPPSPLRPHCPAFPPTLSSSLSHHHPHLPHNFTIIIMVTIVPHQSSIHSLLTKWPATGKNRGNRKVTVLLILNLIFALMSDSSQWSSLTEAVIASMATERLAQRPKSKQEPQAPPPSE